MALHTQKKPNLGFFIFGQAQTHFSSILKILKGGGSLESSVVKNKNQCIRSPSAQRFRCFGCGCHGNVIQLVADAENVPYVEARAKLKNKYGIKGFDHIKSEPSPFYSNHKQVIFDYVVNAFNYSLTSGAPEAFKYMVFLEKHGIDQEQIANYKIGLAPPDDEILVKHLWQTDIT